LVLFKIYFDVKLTLAVNDDHVQ